MQEAKIERAINLTLPQQAMRFSEKAGSKWTTNEQQQQRVFGHYSRIYELKSISGKFPSDLNYTATDIDRIQFLYKHERERNKFLLYI